jgi:hypothetical protein
LAYCLSDREIKDKGGQNQKIFKCKRHPGYSHCGFPGFDSNPNNRWFKAAGSNLSRPLATNENNRAGLWGLAVFPFRPQGRRINSIPNGG